MPSNSQSRTVKVFCTGPEQEFLAARYDVVEEYDSFLLIRVSPSQAKNLAREHPTEDITEQFVIRIGDRAIDTCRPRIDPGGKTRSHATYRGVKALSPGKHHYLVQFIGPVKKAWLRNLKKLGGEPRTPFAGFAYVVRCDEEALVQIVAQPFVRWAGHLSHRDRLMVSDKAQMLPRTRTLEGVYAVEFFDKEDRRKGVSAARALGFTILDEGKTGLMTVRVDAPATRRKELLGALSAVHGVRSIRARSLKRTSNDVAAGIMNTDKAFGNPLGLSGKGETVAVCDTGLDMGDPDFVHEDFAGRVAAIRSYPIEPTFTPYIHNPGGDDGAADVSSGHGTHVAGSILGSGAASAGLSGQDKPIRGLAYEARLVFQAVEQEVKWKSPIHELRYGRYLLAGIPEDLGDLFRFAYGRGARIHSNSWGGGTPGEYDAQCHQLDEFVWKNKDFCVVVAAGNDGTDRDGDGHINPMSVTSPATAKNCITVGATENMRAQFAQDTYGAWWPRDYPAPPYKNDPMADDSDQIVAFSSRGPTQDGRIKPDVVAPGTFILSTRSRKLPPSQTAWAPFPPSPSYFYMGGTSMATPLVSGAVALLRQFLREWVGYDSPSAALLKSSLILGAMKLPGQGPPDGVCDNHQGYGRVNVDAVVASAPPTQAYFLDDRVGLQTGQSDEFEIRVRSSKHPFRVAMAYSDFPGSSLINNLNLLMTDPQGRHHVGNGKPAGLLEPDTRNNVEVIHVERPEKGAWRLRVIASNVPRGPQEYAFALSGDVTA